MNHAHRYRLLACDIDNTLLRFPDPPSPRVAGAIRAAIEAGITVVLVTGRAFRRARPIALSLDLTTPIVCNHGGSIRDLVTQRTLQRQTLPRALVSEIVIWLQARGVCSLVFDGDQIYRNCLPDQVVPDFHVYVTGEHSFFARDLPAHLPEQADVVLATSLSHERLSGLFEGAMEQFGAQARVMLAHSYGLDILPQKATKAAALSWLVGDLGIERQEVMAVGDGGNDADMLSWAGLGVAVGDGTPQALAAADVIAPPFDQDGLAWAIERYLLAANPA